MAPDEPSDTSGPDTRDLEDLRRQVEENLARTQPRLGGHLSGGHRPGRVLRRVEVAEGSPEETSYYLPPQHWWHGRWFLILVAVLGAIVVAQALGFFPWSADDSPGDGTPLAPVLIESTTTTFPTTTTTVAATTTSAPPPTTAAPIPAAPTTLAPTPLPPTTAAPPPPPPPPPLPPATAAPTTSPVVTTRPPTTAPTTSTSFFVPPPTTVPPEPGVG